MENINIYTEEAIRLVMMHGPKLVLAVVVLIVGLSLANYLTRFFKLILVARKIDPTLTPFLTNLLGWGLKALLFISVASMVGIETTSFIAVIGAAGLAVGLALQGSLANFAGGVLILIFRPFKVGDYISTQDHNGTVETIDVFATSIMTPDNRRVILPNGPLAGGPIKNYTAK